MIKSHFDNCDLVVKLLLKFLMNKFHFIFSMFDYPSDDDIDEDSISPELEAELYSRIHYGVEDEVPEENETKEDASKIFIKDATPDITENLSLEVLNEVLNRKVNSLVESVISVPKSPSPTPDVISLSDDDVIEEESKYESNTKIAVKSNDHSSDSEDDSGIQIVKETKSNSKKKPLVLDLVDESNSSSDSEVEHLPCFKRQAEKLVIEHEVPPAKKSRQSDTIPKKTPPKFRRDSSSSSSDSSDVDSCVLNDLSLNLNGIRSNDHERSFAQVVGDNSQDTQIEQVNKWTPEMKDFYCDVDTKMADITIDEIFKDMPSDRNLWIVRKPHSTPSRR